MSYVGNKPPFITIPADDSVTSAMIVDGTITSGDMAVDPRNATNLNAGDVPLAQLDNVDTSGIISNRDDIALLGFKVAANGSLAKYNLVDQTVDDFQDTSGVNAGSSTNEVRDSSGKYYKGEGTTTPTISGNYDSSTVDGDYTYYKWTTVTGSGTFTTNTAQSVDLLIVAGGGGGGHDVGGGGGAGGFRYLTSQSIGAATHTVVVGAGGAGSTSGSGAADSGANSSFAISGGSTLSGTGGGGGGNYSTGVPTTGGSGGGARGYSTGTGLVGAAGNAGGYTPVEGYKGGDKVGNTNSTTGSGGGGSSAVGSNSIEDAAGYTAGGAGTSNSITGSAVTYAIGGDGGGDSWSGGANGIVNTGGGGDGAGTTSYAGGTGIVILRRETSTTAEGANMTLVSTTTAAQAAPTKGDVVLTYTNGAGTTTLDTDLTAEISADGGSTWTALALGSEGSTGSHNIATSHDVTISSTITSPWNMAYRIKTLNQSASKTTRIQAVSLGWS